MTGSDVKAELARHNITIKQLAIEIECNDHILRQVLNGDKHLRKAENFLNKIKENNEKSFDEQIG